EDTVNQAIKTANIAFQPCKTVDIRIHGADISNHEQGHWTVYGSDAEKIKSLISEENGLGEKLHVNYPHVKAEVVWAIREEMARTIEDVLARRIRMLFLDAKKAAAAAHAVAQVMAEELNRDAQWIEGQTAAFTKLAFEYLPEKSVIAT